MALNFPNSPTLNQVYTDTTSGFSYQWNGTVWISFSPSSSGQIKILDDFSASFNNSTQTFALATSGVSIIPPTPQSLIINLGGVIQDPTDDYSVTGSNITFSTPPTSGLSFSGISLGPAVPMSTILDGTVTDGSLRISTTAVVGSATTFTEDLVVSGDARVTGILTVGTSSITLNGSSNIINVGTGVTIDGDSGSISAQEFIGTGDNLIFSPTITSFSPTDGATGVSALSSPNIVLTYDQPVVLGVGTITLRTVSAAGTIAESYEVGVSTRATISNQTLTIDPISNFDYNQEYYVTIPQGGIRNYFNGNSTLLNNYNFSTEAGPTLSSVSPGIGSTNVALDTNVILTFNKTIRAGVGTITLRTVSAGGTIVESYDVASSGRLTFSTNTLTIDPTSNLGVGVTHFVVVPNNAVAGYTGIDTYSFTTLSFSFLSITPTNGATNIGISTNVTLSFSSPPTRGTGTIQLRSGSTSGSVIESFDAVSSGRISISGNNYIIDPTSNLGFSTSIHTIIPSTAIPGYVGLNTTGADTHSFTTLALNLGESYEGGFVICKASPVRWVVSPYSAEVSRTWHLRNDANTTAQSVSGCTGWFVPSMSRLQNPGYLCRSFWGPSPCYSSASYWSYTAGDVHACRLTFSSGTGALVTKTNTYCVRAFRCVTY